MKHTVSGLLGAMNKSKEEEADTKWWTTCCC